MLIKYREILRHSAQDLSNRGIASSCGCSRNTVADILKKARELAIECMPPIKQRIFICSTSRYVKCINKRRYFSDTTAKFNDEIRAPGTQTIVSQGNLLKGA